MLTKSLSSCDLGFSFQVCKIGMIIVPHQGQSLPSPQASEPLVWKLLEAQKAVPGSSLAFSFLTEPCSSWPLRAFLLTITSAFVSLLTAKTLQTFLLQPCGTSSGPTWSCGGSDPPHYPQAPSPGSQRQNVGGVDGRGGEMQP